MSFRTCTRYVVSHVHVSLLYLDRFKIDLNLDVDLDNVMGTDYLGPFFS